MLALATMFGATLNDHYRIGRKLGKGASGDVYEGVNIAIGKPVAIKVLTPAARNTEEALARFQREARAISRLSHPHIVQIFDSGVAQGAPFLVMELCEGQTLTELLRTEAPLPPVRAVAMVRQVASALVEAHRHGVVHRDIKPSNLLLTRTSGQDHIKILDFGIARWLFDDGVRLTQTGAILGTPTYMAPEQADSSRRSIDGRADLYAVGVILYEMLTGHPPFSGRTVVDMLVAHATLPVPALPDTTPPALRAVVQRLLEKRPEQRYPSAAALLSDLSAPGLLEPWSRSRYWTPAALLSAAVLLSLAGWGLQAHPPEMLGPRAAPVVPPVSPPAPLVAPPDKAVPPPPQVWSLNEVKVRPRRSAGVTRSAVPAVDPQLALQLLREAYANGDYSAVVRLYPQVRVLTRRPIWEPKDWLRVADSACELGVERLARFAAVFVGDEPSHRRVVRTCGEHGIVLR